MYRVLVADDDAALRLSVVAALHSTKRFVVEEASNGREALDKIKTTDFSIDIAILDVDMPEMTGLEVLRKIKEHNPGIIVLILTAYANIENAVEAVKEGAFDYLSKPVKFDDLVAVLDKSLKAHALISHLVFTSPVLMEEGRNFIGNTTQMQKVFGIIYKLSKVDTPVLIRGDSGTGKELVARAIHYNSIRKESKFVAVNCSAIPETLFESELFGHEKGSFTGADQRKIGKFQFAEGGTLFLDEVGDLPPLMQVKLLRVLQEKVFTPVGSHREISSQVRIIAATNRPLEEMMKRGTFREDLFYRLNVIPIFLPSLAERKEDLQSLTQAVIKKFNLVHNKKIIGITADAMNVLKKYSWPGNVRELENVIEHGFVMESTQLLTLRSLPEKLLLATETSLPFLENNEESHDPSVPSSDESYILMNGNEDSHKKRFFESSKINNNQKEIESDDEESGPVGNLSNLEGDMDFSEVNDVLSAGNVENMDYLHQKELFEKEFIIKALKHFKGRINQTALHANIPKKTLLRKIEKYGINAKDYISSS